MHTMSSMDVNKGEFAVGEKEYKTMSGAGALNIVLGVVSVCVGVASGVLLIISGAKLLARKSQILF